MKTNKRFLNYINKLLGSLNFINILGLLFWLFIISSVTIIIIIYFTDNPTWQIGSTGFNNLFDIYKFPFYLLAASLAIITLRITLVRVTQTDKQLEAIYKPELYISEGVLFSRAMVNENKNIYFMFTTSQVYMEPKLYILNIGVAAAIDINSSFEYDIKTAIKVFTHLDKNKEFIINYENDLLTIKSSITNYEAKLFNINDENQVRTKNFLFPTADGKISYALDLPLYYCEIYNLFTYLILNTEQKDYENAIPKNEIERLIIKNNAQLPTLFLSFTFKDIANNSFSKKFSVKLLNGEYTMPIKNNLVGVVTNNFFINSTNITS